MFVTVLTTNPVTADTFLFQSPPETEQSSEEAPPVEELPTETPVPPPTATPEIPPTPTIPEPPTVAQPTAPALQLPVPETPPIQPDVQPPLEPDERLETPPAAGRGSFIFDRAEFIDTVIIGVSWIWLCCGIGLFLFVPLFLLLLQIRGMSKLSRRKKST